MRVENQIYNLNSTIEELNNELVTKETFEPEKRRTERIEHQNSRIVPVKLTSKEAHRVLRCQKVMLDYARMQYKKSIGSEKEDMMRKMYNDAIVDYQTFMTQYEKELGMN